MGCRHCRRRLHWWPPGRDRRPGLAQTPAGNRVLARPGRLQPGQQWSMLPTAMRASRGDLPAARADYDKARKAQAAAGLPRSQRCSRTGCTDPVRWTPKAGALELLAEANLRLAALFRRQTSRKWLFRFWSRVKLMTPAKPQGQEAYQSLLNWASSRRNSRRIGCRPVSRLSASERIPFAQSPAQPDAEAASNRSFPTPTSPSKI